MRLTVLPMYAGPEAMQAARVYGTLVCSPAGSGISFLKIRGGGLLRFQCRSNLFDDPFPYPLCLALGIPDQVRYIRYRNFFHIP